jgi:hypothetical protein
MRASVAQPALFPRVTLSRFRLTICLLPTYALSVEPRPAGRRGDPDGMMRERIGRLALRSFPREARAQRGREMLDTMLEAGSGSTRTFAYEATSLWFAGLRERARAGAQVGTGSLVADGFRLAAVIWVALVLAVLLRPRLEMHGRSPHVVALLILVVLICWALGYRRAAGVFGFVVLGCGVARWLGPLEAPNSPLWCLLAWYAVPFIGFVLMIVGPSPPSRVLRRRAWMLPLSAIAVLLVPVDASGIVPGVLIGLSGLTIAGLLLIVVDPRLWIATALVWTATGVYLTAMSAAGALDEVQLRNAAVLLTWAAPAAIVLTHVQIQWRRRTQRQRGI